MSSVQERLQLKRVPLDNWSIREQLCLASAVVRSGDQNWMSVSRSLKSIADPNRPADWYSQKSCAAQYGVLLENVETPKRKKRSSESAVETPQESILKKLTQERIVEIQKTLAEMNQQYDQMKTDLTEIRNPVTSEDRLKEMWAAVEAAKRARERETAKRAAWLKEREERRARAEKTWRPPSSTPTGTTAGTETPTLSSPVTAAPTPSSPLLTSLLKSSPVVTTPQHISHPANVVDSVSPSAGAPTLSLLLEPGRDKHAAIEHIKSQLVQLERRLTARTSSAAAPLDIDDIEIKAEDVYAFRDVDIHIPPVATLHKGTARPSDKPEETKDGAEETSAVVDTTSEDIAEENVVKEEQPDITEAAQEEMTEVETITQETVVQEPQPEPEAAPPEPEIKISFPEVKFPTPEIKVIHPEDQKVKEEVKEPEIAPQPEESQAPKQEVVIEDQAMEVEESLPSEATPQPIEEQPQELPVEPPLPETEEIKTEDIPLPPDTSAPAEEIVQSEEPPPLPTEPAPAPEPETAQPEEAKEAKQPEAPGKEPETTPETQEQEAETQQEVVEEIKKDDAEDTVPLKEMVAEESKSLQETEVKPEKREEDTHTETDDDAPMELSREEEKDGKKKRDYSRKKKSDSRKMKAGRRVLDPPDACSGSESATEQSAPESPATDLEKLHRLWKKSVMLVYSRLCAHKYASLFARPITDEEAPRYSRVVRRPMDLSTIRKHIDNGTLRTTAEFQRDILLMLTNALMYNNTQHSVYGMAKEMFEEAKNQLGMLLAAQAHAGLCQPTRIEPTRKRTRNEMSR